MSAPLHIAGGDAIAAGRTTDVYFPRTLELLAREGVDPEVAVEVRARSLPGTWPWAMLAGLEEATLILPPELAVRALPEGAVKRGDFATILNEEIGVDELAAHAGTIGYEVLTALGRRYARIYRGG